MQELEQMVREHRLQEALILLRRVCRCPSQAGRLFLSDLASGKLTWSLLAAKHPDIVAPLCGDPPPSLLQRFAPRRSELVRFVRRGRRLDALRLIQSEGLELAVARLFLDTLEARWRHWDAVLARYQKPPADFFAGWPPPEVEEPESTGVVLLPDSFEPQYFASLVAQGEIRPAVLLVRRISGSGDSAAFVDRYEELADRGRDPWPELAREYAEIVAALSGLPNPLWLIKLTNFRSELVGYLSEGRKLAASQLVASVVGCEQASRVRRFLSALGKGENWDATLQRFRAGFTWPPPAAQGQPKLPAKKVKPRPPASPAKLKMPKNLAEALPLLQRLRGLQDKQQQIAALRQLEAAGLDRNWIVSQAPWMDNLLPRGELSAAALPVLQQLVESGGKPPQEVLIGAAEQLLGTSVKELPSAEVSELLRQVERCIDTGDWWKLQDPVKKLMQHGFTQKQLEDQFPQLKEYDGRAVGEELLRRINPELPEMLGDERTIKLLAAIPRLKVAMSSGDVAGASKLLFKEIGLGPLDAADVIDGLKKLL